jgi:hypothetical protein
MSLTFSMSEQQTLQDITRHLLQRVDSIERRLDDRIQTTFICNTNNDNTLFLEVGFEKRLSTYMRQSPAFTHHITDTDIDDLIDTVRRELVHTNVMERGFVECLIYRIESHNLFDVCLRIHGTMSQALNKHEKIKLYEGIEKAYKVRLGHVFGIVPMTQNKYEGYKLHLRKQFTL